MPPVRGKLLILLAATVATAGSPAVAGAVVLTFAPSGTERAFRVPPGVSSLDVVAVGARGGSTASQGVALAGGFGSRVSATLTGLTPGSLIYLTVGGEGAGGVCGGAGGFNGGGSGGLPGCAGGGGGGASDIRTCSASDGSCDSLASRLLVAAGGGGAGGTTNAANARSGAGGDAGVAGGDVAADCRGIPTGGGPGGAAAGGAGGASGTEGTAGGSGALGLGGAGGTGTFAPYTGAGGGGGGLYGGGGGGSTGYCSAGGGGGSDLVPPGGTRSVDTGGAAFISIDVDAATAVTSPADGDAVIADLATSPTIPVSGTANAAVAAVDVGCLRASGFEPLGGAADAVPVAAGRWSAPAVPLPTNLGPDPFCRLVAVPAGSQPATFASFTGPRLRTLSIRRPARGVLVDYDAFAGGLEGGLGIGSLGNCGLRQSYLVDSGATTAGPLSCAGGLSSSDPADSNSPSIVVDGAPTYVGYMAANAYFGASGVPGFAGLSVTPSIAPDGSLVLTESTPVLRCETGADPLAFPPVGPCLSFADAGVRIDVVHTVARDGRTVRVVQTLTSTDGAPHTVTIVQWHALVSQGEYLLPGQGAYATPANGATFSPPSGPGSVLSRPGSGSSGRSGAAITYASAPDTIVFPAGPFGLPPEGFATRYLRRAVAAGAPLRLAFVYSGRLDPAALADAAGADRQSLRPSLSVRSPASGAVSRSATVTVAGTASDALGPVALEVAGRTVAVGADGAWSTDAALTPGENTIVLRATNVLGLATEERLVVTLRPPDAPPAGPLELPSVPRPGGLPLAASLLVSRSGRPASTLRRGAIVVRPGIDVRCPVASPPCDVLATAHAYRPGLTARLASHLRRLTIGRSQLRLAPGARRALAIRLNRYGTRLLRRHGRLRIAVRITSRAGSTTAAKVRRVLLVSSPAGRAARRP